MKKRTGFTLIELLIVIAIISILASILLPVFASAREKARQTVCVSNLRQIGMLISMHTMDYEGVYPGPEDVLGHGGIYKCPSDADAAKTGCSYEMNSLLVRQPEALVGNPSDTVMAIDAGYDDGYFDLGTSINSDTPIPVMTWEYGPEQIPNPMHAVHLGRADILYADGHVRSAKFGELTASSFIP